jgi:hypothetical protein
LAKGKVNYPRGLCLIRLGDIVLRDNKRVVETSMLIKKTPTFLSKETLFHLARGNAWVGMSTKHHRGFIGKHIS